MIVLKSFHLLRISSEQCSKQIKVAYGNPTRTSDGLQANQWQTINEVSFKLCPAPLVEAHSVQDTIYIVVYSKVNDSPCSLLTHLALFQKSLLLMKTWKLL